MIKRALFRIQPIEHLRKRKQRYKDMLKREKQFAEFLAKEEAKIKRRADNE
jgi:hypothetical protein